jgi:Fic family protein
MLPGDKEPFEPQKLPLRRLNRSSFSRAHSHAKKNLHRFQKILDSIPQPQYLLSSLMAAEALAALESQKIRLPLEDFFLLCLTHSHRNKKMLQPIYYYTALKRACNAIRTQHISKEMLCAIHQMVKKGAPPHIRPGDYRIKQNWIGPEGCKREEAHFFPPSAKIMRPYMQNLLQNLDRHEKDPLTHIAIVLAQLLILHPFMDGNGRVARILIPLLFYQKKVLSYPLLFFSRYLKDHRAKYFNNLFAITSAGKWEQWIRFFLKGIIHQTKNECEKAETIYTLYLKLKTKLSKHYPRTAFLFFLFSQPVFARSTFIQRYSNTLLKDLIDLKIIAPFKKGYYTFPALLRIIKSKNLER